MNSKTLVAAFLFCGFTLSAVAEPVCRRPLMAPPGYYQTVNVERGGEYECPEFPQPYTENMEFPSKYAGSDSARATLNPKADRKYQESVESIRELEKTSVEVADDYIRGAGPGARECLLDGLHEWAEAGALLADEVNHIGEAVRKWALAATGAAYLEIVQLRSEAPPLDDDHREDVEAWFARLAEQVMAYYSDREPRKVNNHDYWAAWAVMLAAVNLQDCEMFEWSLTKFREGIYQIDANGFLANELRRESRALNYQNFALQPLMMVATFAKANQRLSAAEQEALQRLVEAVAEGIRDPRLYHMMTGEEQEMEGVVSGWSLAWMQPWRQYFDAEPNGYLDELGIDRFYSTRLGGDLTWLFSDKALTGNEAPIKPVPPEFERD